MKYVILIHSNPQSRQIWESFSDEQRAQGLRASSASALAAQAECA